MLRSDPPRGRRMALRLVVAFVATSLAAVSLGAAAHALEDEPTAGIQIVGGEVAAPGELPWQVGLLQANISDNFQAQYCGGSLLSATIVLTAAHCVEGAAPHHVDVLAGTTSLSSGGQRIPVAAITMHPNYNSNTLAFDLAVLELQSPAASPAVPIDVADAPDAPYWVPGTLATTSGWGRLAESGGWPTLLHKVQVPIVSDPDCTSAYGNWFKAASMVCAGFEEGGKDACQGDSGGPLAVQRPDASWVLVGVVSWGVGCARPGNYGVYAEVAAATAWIKSFLGGSGTGPVIDSVSPSTGPASGGTNVTITGSGFTGASQVSFGATPANFRIDSDSQIRVRTPAGTGTVDVRVVTPAGTSPTGPSAQFTYSGGGGGGDAPTITGLDRSSGAPGSRLIIEGTNFTGATQVTFDGVAAPRFRVVSPTAIRAEVPAGAGPVQVVVHTPSGSSNAVAFTIS